MKIWETETFVHNANPSSNYTNKQMKQNKNLAKRHTTPDKNYGAFYQVSTII